jgi:hypothetical protein
VLLLLLLLLLLPPLRCHAHAAACARSTAASTRQLTPSSHT